MNRASSSTTFRSLSEATPPTISRLIQHARRLQRVASTIKELLPPALAAHCQPGNIANDTLTIYLDSSAWATKIRYFSPQLLAHLGKSPQTSQVKQIRIVVHPLLFQRPPVIPTSYRRTLSPASAALLREAAIATESPRLSAALHRLARHAEKQGEDDSRVVTDKITPRSPAS